MIWLFLINMTSASTVLIQSPHSSTLDYKASLRAYSDFVSPSDDYLSRHPVSSSRERLLTLFARAQRSFLELSNAEAKQDFQQVLNLVWSDDWEKSDRETFLYVYLRMAQMEAVDAERDKWLTQALQIGADLEPDASLFPPPLLQRLKDLSRSLPKRTTQFKKLGSGWSVLINGRLCEKQDCVGHSIYPGKVRVTFISDQFLPQTVTLDTADLESYVPRAQPWVEGACNQEQYHRDAERFAARKVFWNLECEAPKAELNLAPVPVKADPLVRFSEPAKTPTPFYKSKWLWAGVGVAVIAVIVANSQRKPQESTEPSTTYGY